MYKKNVAILDLAAVIEAAFVLNAFVDWNGPFLKFSQFSLNKVSTSTETLEHTFTGFEISPF